MSRTGSDAAAHVPLRKNLTRRSVSVPARLVSEGAFHLLPLYGLLTLSDLAREAIANSGSYRFADHLYRGEASGRFVVGRWLDRLLLRLPAARAFRRRHTCARDAMHFAIRLSAARGHVRVLTVPCGIPRDIAEVAATLEREEPTRLARVEYVGMDIDPEVLEVAAEFLHDCPLVRRVFHQGDALQRDQYPSGRFHVVASTGLGEFLTDEELRRLCANVFDILEPGGTFYISATASDPRSDRLLRMIELDTHYRTHRQLETVVRCQPWRRMTFVVDRTGLQTFATLVK